MQKIVFKRGECKTNYEFCYHDNVNNDYLGLKEKGTNLNIYIIFTQLKKLKFKEDYMIIL